MQPGRWRMNNCLRVYTSDIQAVNFVLSLHLSLHDDMHCLHIVQRPLDLFSLSHFVSLFHSLALSAQEQNNILLKHYE